MATVGELAARLGRSPQTLRNWCEAYSAFLSASAVPQAGKPRHFTAQDEQVLFFIHQQDPGVRGYEPIREALEAGAHLQGVAPAPDASSMAEGAETGTGLTLRQMTALIGQQQGTIETLREERDRLLSERDTAHERARAALERAARAEGKLELWQSLQSQQRPPSAAPGDQAEQR